MTYLYILPIHIHDLYIYDFPIYTNYSYIKDVSTNRFGSWRHLLISMYCLFTCAIRLFLWMIFTVGFIRMAAGAIEAVCADAAFGKPDAVHKMLYLAELKRA